jgi:calcineurin-like phosphoesterase family protein
MKIVEKINGEHLKFISDIHYNHAGMLKFGYPSRENWNDVVEMNRGLEQILTNEINSEDTLIDLGDMFWKISVPEALRILNKIKAKKFYKINGNHDSWNLWTKYPDITNFPTARGDIMDFVVGLGGKDYRISVSHYPLLSWNHKSRGALMIHGHCHGNSDEANNLSPDLRVDVGFDGGLAQKLGHGVTTFQEIVEYFNQKTGGVDYKEWTLKNCKNI